MPLSENQILVNSSTQKVLKLDKVSSQSDLERLRSCLTEETLDGKIVKSRAEKRIADYLFEHDLKYNYEFPFTTDDSNVIRPDFYISSPFKIIHITSRRCNFHGDTTRSRYGNETRASLLKRR